MDAEALIRDGAAKVEAIVREAGPKVAEAAEHVVRYNWAHAFSICLICGVLILLTPLLGYIMYRSACIKVPDYDQPGRQEADTKQGTGLIVPGFLIVLILTIAVPVFCEHLPTVIEPTGYTIQKLMGVK